MMNVKSGIVGLIIVVLASCMAQTKRPNNEVKIIGAMKNVMWKGMLSGSISLDTIANKTNLYGLGPVEYLSGEILIMDGKSYVSTVISDTTMKVEETFHIKAPFFGYTAVLKWSEQTLPDSIQTMLQLEQFLHIVTLKRPCPFFFKLTGTVEQATIHVMNLPKGTKVSSPEEAHQGQVNFEINNEQSDLVGFFSTAHQSIFTHHDTYIHVHLITADRQKMGHLDKVRFKKGTMRLFLPQK